MTNYAYDEKLPYVVEFDGAPIARFLSKSDAGYWADEEGGKVIDTTPLKLPEGTGAVVLIEGSMPLVKIGSGIWVMPMSTGYTPYVGYYQACRPLNSNKALLSDDDVRELITLKGGKFESHPGV